MSEGCVEIFLGMGLTPREHTTFLHSQWGELQECRRMFWEGDVRDWRERGRVSREFRSMGALLFVGAGVAVWDSVYSGGHRDGNCHEREGYGDGEEIHLGT